MKTVSLTVHVTANVPDDVDTDTLFLHMQPSDFAIGGGQGDLIEQAEVTEFCTANVELLESVPVELAEMMDGWSDDDTIIAYRAWKEQGGSDKDQEGFDAFLKQRAIKDKSEKKA